MRPDLQFFGWDAPIIDRLCTWLLPENIEPPMDLSNTLVIVPTRQAGRRLREALAMRCEEHDCALIPPLVGQPTFFMDHPTTLRRIAGPTLALATWSHLLRHIPLDEYTGLFPTVPAAQDSAWSLHTARLIQSLRAAIAEGGWLIRDVVQTHGETLEEPERWQDLERLEGAYLERLDALGKTDRCAELICQADAPALPDPITRIVIAAVPDPTPLMLRALTALADRYPITVLVQAPADLAHLFDAWGRPNHEEWTTRLIDLPDADQNLHVGATPIEQARLVMRMIAEQPADLGPADLAIGVPDSSVAPYVDAHLSEHGLIAYNPAGLPVNQHRLFYALSLCRELFSDPSYSTLRHVARHPDLLSALDRAHGLKSAPLLRQWDRFQNEYLPQALADFRARRGQDPVLDRLVEAIDALRESRKRPSLEEVVARITELLYNGYEIDPQTPEGDGFRKVAQRINSSIAETRDEAFVRLEMNVQDTLQLVLHALDGETVYEEREGAQVDLEGWLELPWNNAPLLIVTGMNEGMVPDGKLSDVFLPDSLRKRLGLRCDMDRLKRDAYLMTTLIESRRHAGRVQFITGSFSRSGDPLKPSRLLFRCSDEELPARTRLLFREPAPSGINHPSTVSFTLDPTRLPPPAPFTRISVTAFRDYLACPFRFYLKHLAKLRESDDLKIEMDAMDFGEIIHIALEGLKDAPDLASEADLVALFQRRADVCWRERFGDHAPLHMRIQYESAKQRLAAAARVQADLVKQGWRPTYFEKKLVAIVNDIQVSGKIDRVDYHAESNTWRVIDYKTMDVKISPDKSYFATPQPETPDYARVQVSPKGRPSEKRWTDLQLPLYELLFATLEHHAVVEVALFHLPRAVTATELEPWTACTTDLRQSALTCARGVIADIRNGVFWPPSEKVQYDDFEWLFPFPAAQCIQPPSAVVRDPS